MFPFRCLRAVPSKQACSHLASRSRVLHQNAPIFSFTQKQLRPTNSFTARYFSGAETTPPVVDYSWRSAVMGRLEDMHQTINLHRALFFQGVIGVIAVAGWVIFFFDDEIKVWWGRQGADVGKMVLSDKSLQEQAEVLSKALAERVLTDPNMERLAVQFVFQVVDQLLDDPNTVNRAVSFLQEVCTREETKQAAAILTLSALSHPATQEFVSTYFSNLIVSQPIIDSSTKLGAQVAHNALNSPQLQKHAAEMMSEVMNDKKLQHDAGEFLWSAIKYAITPWRISEATAKEVALSAQTKHATSKQ